MGQRCRHCGDVFSSHIRRCPKCGLPELGKPDWYIDKSQDPPKYVSLRGEPGRSYCACPSCMTFEHPKERSITYNEGAHRCTRCGTPLITITIVGDTPSMPPTPTMPQTPQDRRLSIPPKTRFDVLKRDSYTCQYCGRKSPDVMLEVDHIVPVSKGGEDDIDNLITSCYECNRGKRAKDVV